MQEHGLICPIDAGQRILDFRSKMADWREIRDFPILNIWEPFRGQISVLNDLTWTCLCMNMVLYVPLMQVISF